MYDDFFCYKVFLKCKIEIEKLTSLDQKLNQSNTEKEIRAQEIKDFLKDKDNRQEL